MSSPTGDSSRFSIIRGLIIVMVGAALLVVFEALGAADYRDWVMDVGSVRKPRRDYVVFLAYWTVLGGLSAIVIASGLRYLPPFRSTAALLRGRNPIPDWLWMTLFSVGAFVIPLVIRNELLFNTPLTDDESAYEFMAEVLAMGRLTAPSHPERAFFDRLFMVNDGAMYSQYFVGWPALMAPGVWLGDVGLMNPVYSGLTVPPLFLVIRRLAGAPWAKFATLMYIASPMLMIGAATLMSHTSCVWALAWLSWFVARGRDPDAPWWSHVGVASFFSITFFIRPTSAIGAGAPLLVWWGMGWLNAPRQRMLAMALAFLVPAAAFSGAFFAVNKIQNGSYTMVSYQRALRYTTESEFPIKRWKEFPEERVANLRFGNPRARAATQGIAIFRMNYALFGWPSSFIFVLFAGWRRHAGVYWASLLGFFAAHLFVAHVGVDSFAPVHYYETAWPFLVLSALGLRNLTDHIDILRFRSMAHKRRMLAFPVSLLVALIMVSAFSYGRRRLLRVRDLAKNVALPEHTAKSMGLTNAVIFATRPFAKNCFSRPSKHFVFWRPNNDPYLTNDILWVNSRDLRRNKDFMTNHFPDRRGYMMLWGDCFVEYLEVADLTSQELRKRKRQIAKQNRQKKASRRH